MKKLIYLFAILAIASINANARSKRTAQIPNGIVNDCLNCHTDMDGNGLNVFGNKVKSTNLTKPVTSASNVIWDATLAGLDSDGDGFSNGQELQDPNGTWVKGTVDPGNASAVSNPGVKASIPTSIIDEITNYNFSVSSIYSNIANNDWHINYKLEIAGMLNVVIYDFNGILVKNLLFETQNAGSYSIKWDRYSNDGVKLNSGVYFIQFNFNGKSLVKKIAM